jgi:hypothetical protein
LDEGSRRSFAVDAVKASPSDLRATHTRTPSETETHSTSPERKNAENYQFFEEIGRGSSAVVMRAEVAGEEVAVKVFDIGKESFKSELKNKILSVGTTPSVRTSFRVRVLCDWFLVVHVEAITVLFSSL